MTARFCSPVLACPLVLLAAFLAGGCALCGPRGGETARATGPGLADRTCAAGPGPVATGSSGHTLAPTAAPPREVGPGRTPGTLQVTGKPQNLSPARVRLAPTPAPAGPAAVAEAPVSRDAPTPSADPAETVVWLRPTPAPALPGRPRVHRTSGPVSPQAASAPAEGPSTAASPGVAAEWDAARLADPGGHRLADVVADSDVVFWN